MPRGERNNDPLKNGLVDRIYRATKSELAKDPSFEVGGPVRLAFQIRVRQYRKDRYFTVRLTEVQVNGD